MTQRDGAGTSVSSQQVESGSRPLPQAERKRAEWNIKLGILSFLGVGVLWELVSRVGLVSPIFLPPASAVGRSLLEFLISGSFYFHFGVTAFETVTGFVLGSLLAFILGAILAYSQILRQLSYPYVVAFQCIPKVMLAPLFLTWFGLGYTSKVVMAAAISFFPVLVNTMVGLSFVDDDMNMLMRSYVATKSQVFWKVALPNALPTIFAGLVTSATIALIGSIVAEQLTANAGLGMLMYAYSFSLQIPRVFGVIIMTSLLGYLLYAVVEFAGRKIVFWHSAKQYQVF